MGLVYRSGGESHGAGCLALLEGLPKDLDLDLAFVDAQLARRQAGHGRGGRQRLEQDRAEVLGGWRGGRLIEAPLVLWIANRDRSLEDLPQLVRPRPGHADLAGCLRHGDRDIRANLERASARETAARVAAGAVAQLLLRRIGVEVLGHVIRIGDVASGRPIGGGLHDVADLRAARAAVEASPVSVLDAELESPMVAAIDRAKADRDSLGGAIEVVAVGVPAGLGSFAQWDQKLDGRLAQALMSIPAVKAVEVGAGTVLGSRRGSDAHDPVLPDPDRGFRRPSNHAGGLEGGITNGEPVVLRVTKKPIATLRRALPSVDLASGAAAEAAYERADVCAVPAAAVVAEAMTALTLAAAALELFGGATLASFTAAWQAHVRRARSVIGGGSGGSAGAVPGLAESP